mmetsp:Transcript_18459/g.56424  ORF Transcript_18459/g.56424 Transcript_18459/m.56424 type:complete len:170 (-) Transcript_18459:72-581(-)
MSVEAGTKIPDVKLFEGQPEYAKAHELRLGQFCAGKKVVVFAVPGAFTPGCSMSHLPSFVENAAALKAQGVDAVICTATNDPYVMEAWGRDQKAQDADILMLSDKDAELAKALGVASEGAAMTRSARYAMIVEDGVITTFLPAVKPNGEKWSSNTYAPAVLEALSKAAV